METIRVGLVGESTETVTARFSARNLGSGGVDVFGTPAMVALMEAAAVSAIDPLLPDGQASVGTVLDIKHVAATPLGQEVHARAEVTAVEGRRVTFRVQAWDETQRIGEGTHTRVVIDVERFMGRLAGRQDE